MCMFLDVSESDLKDLILQIKSNFPDAGERIVLGHRVCMFNDIGFVH